MKFRTLREVALDLCIIHLGDPEGAKTALAVRALRSVLDELSIHINANIVSKYFTISENYTVQMPADTMDVLKVGVMDTCGRIRWMGTDYGVRRDIPQTSGCSCTDTTSTDEVCSACTGHNFFGEGKYGVREHYGYRVPYFPNGTFRFNEKENRIEFGTGYDIAAGAQVLVEYREAYGANEYNLIPAPFAVAVMHKAAALIDMRPGVAASHMNEFRRAYTAYRNGKFTLTADELVSALKGEFMSAPKI